ncbi:MAG: hypothetical protein AB1941_15640 [Gemmatimonadota bacterium]
MRAEESPAIILYVSVTFGSLRPDLKLTKTRREVKSFLSPLSLAMNDQPSQGRNKDDEAMVRAFVDATAGLSIREAVRRSGLNFEAVRAFRNDDWSYMQRGTREKLEAYLTRRGLLPPETSGPAQPSNGDLPFSEAEELIRSFRRYWDLGIFQMLGPNLTEVEVAEKIVQAAKNDGLSARDPAEMARLLHWQADLLERQPHAAPQLENPSNAVARRAGTGTR